eukprot:6196489-Pleurochrysis_carterae.AAC.8
MLIEPDFHDVATHTFLKPAQTIETQTQCLHGACRENAFSTDSSRLLRGTDGSALAELSVPG